VRASKVADSNVAGEVERRVRELVEDDETGAFRPAEDEGPEEAEEGEAPPGGDGDAEADPDSGTEDPEPGEAERDGEGTSGTETDSQVTMGDYL